MDKESLLWFYQKSPQFKRFYIFLSLIFLCLFLFLSTFSYQRNHRYYGEVVDHTIYLYLKEEDQMYFKNPYRINEKNVSCRLEKTKEYLTLKDKIYRQVLLECENIELEEQTVLIDVPLPRTTFLKEMQKKWKGWME